MHTCSQMCSRPTLSCGPTLPTRAPRSASSTARTCGPARPACWTACSPRPTRYAAGALPAALPLALVPPLQRLLLLGAILGMPWMRAARSGAGLGAASSSLVQLLLRGPSCGLPHLTDWAQLRPDSCSSPRAGRPAGMVRSIATAPCWACPTTTVLLLLPLQVDFSEQCREVLESMQAQRLQDWRRDYGMRTACQEDVNKVRPPSAMRLSPPLLPQLVASRQSASGCIGACASRGHCTRNGVRAVSLIFKTACPKAMLCRHMPMQAALPLSLKGKHAPQQLPPLRTAALIRTCEPLSLRLHLTSQRLPKPLLGSALACTGVRWGGGAGQQPGRLDIPLPAGRHRCAQRRLPGGSGPRRLGRAAVLRPSHARCVFGAGHLVRLLLEVLYLFHVSPSSARALVMVLFCTAIRPARLARPDC
jgi:hypothetical protein